MAGTTSGEVPRIANGVDELWQGTMASGGAAARVGRGSTVGAREQSDGVVASTPAIDERWMVVRRRGVRGNRSELGMAWRERSGSNL